MSKNLIGSERTHYFCYYATQNPHKVHEKPLYYPKNSNVRLPVSKLLDWKMVRREKWCYRYAHMLNTLLRPDLQRQKINMKAAYFNMMLPQHKFMVS